ncbi:MAG TPA: hypothetical protein PLY86_10125, partial [bacterium]|nr:hypothetical protein [bacterium]
MPQIDAHTLERLYSRDIIDERLVALPKVKSACLKALFKLGEESGEKSVLAALEGDDIRSRVFAIEAIEYASRKDLLKRFLPLLEDKRDAMPGLESSPGGTNYLKVRDLATNAIARMTGAEFSFKIQNLFSYTDAQINEVKVFLREYQ